jgi:hypothetical protein
LKNITCRRGILWPAVMASFAVGTALATMPAHLHRDPYGRYPQCVT